jgi:hypothetical protein
MNAWIFGRLAAGVCVAAAWCSLFAIGGFAAENPSPVSWSCIGPLPHSAWFKNIRRSGACPPLGRRSVGESSRAAAVSAGPSGLAVAVAGSTVTLTWSSSSAPATSYIVEAGSTSGLSDLARLDTGSASTTLVVTNVPDGTYFVRVRARDAAGGESGPSNEAVATVGASCQGVPAAPSNLTALVADSTVTLRWMQPASSCRASGYVVQAGSASGLSDLANVATGSVDTLLTVTGVADGAYYVRVIATTTTGVSAPSNEVIVAVASACINRTGDPNTSQPPRCVSFAGLQWIVKSSPFFGPGPNAWSDAPDDVWVDERGLHLTITKHGDRWYASEVILNRSLGFGTYAFRTATRLDLVDPNVVVGLFTYNYPDGAFSHRELDIEFSPLLGRVRGANAHFTVQPFENPANMHDFTFVDTAPQSTHTFDWRPDHVAFASGGESWIYRDSGVPQPGGENVRLNLWLFNGLSAPATQARVELVVSGFQFTP